MGRRKRRPLRQTLICFAGREIERKSAVRRQAPYPTERLMCCVGERDREETSRTTDGRPYRISFSRCSSNFVQFLICVTRASPLPKGGLEKWICFVIGCGAYFAKLCK